MSINHITHPILKLGWNYVGPPGPDDVYYLKYIIN